MVLPISRAIRVWVCLNQGWVSAGRHGISPGDYTVGLHLGETDDIE
jgi:hypothetical protein